MRRVVLPPLLQQVLCLPETIQALRALRLIQVGSAMPLIRSLIHTTIEQVEQGEPVAQAVMTLAEKVQVHLEAGASLFLSPEVEGRIVKRVNELTAQRPSVSHPLFPPLPGSVEPRDRLEAFLKIDDDLQALVLQTWRIFIQRLELYQSKKIKLSREDQSDPVSSYRHAASNFLSDSQTELGKLRRIVKLGSDFFPLALKILFDTGEVRPSFHALKKIRRLRTAYGLLIPPQLESVLLEALDQLARRDQEHPINFGNSRSPLAAARRILPAAPRWLHELLIHFYGTSKESEESPDRFGFILRAARLLRGISQDKAEEHGFTHADLFKAEGGDKVRRPTFRRLAILYGVSYERLALAHWQTYYPDLDFQKLTLLRRPVFIDPQDEAKVRNYLRKSPTLGERLCLARMEKDLSFEEADSLMTAHGVNTQYYREAENNKAYPNLMTLRGLEKVLGIPMSELLSLILVTYYPRLRHARLQTEPVWIDPACDGYDVEKIEAYAKNPGTFGEEIFFLRKKRFLSLNDLAAETGISRKRLTAFEHNQKAPTDEERVTIRQRLSVSP